MAKVGVILIGRNEGARLVRALESATGRERPVVYVDSGSTDDSVAAARERDAEVVELDMSVPFTAARARNAGFERLLELHADVDYVQFIDGDCEVVSGWLEAATEVLDGYPDVVAVCGYRRERYPERSLLNRICDVEWRNGPVGPIACFGGDVMIRAAALAQVGGYDASLIAGEDEEVGIRLRHDGGKLIRIDLTSTLHDADMHKLTQWWRRAKRCGHAYAELHARHGAPPERKFAPELRRTWLYGAAVPLGALAFAVPTLGLSTLALMSYPARAVRIALKTRDRGFTWTESVAWSLSCSAAPIPEVVGAAKYHLDRLRNRRSQLIEYK